MTADDAFDKLAAKNALNIPIAKTGKTGKLPKDGKTEIVAVSRPVRGTTRKKGDAHTVIRNKKDLRTTTRMKSDDAEEAMRVLDLIENNAPGDYHPSDYNSAGGEFTTPTETELEAIGERLSDAQARGARVLGRDVDPDEFFDGIGGLGLESAKRKKTNYAELKKTSGLDTVIDATPVPEAHSVLDKARRLRRFAYLPLADMEHFKTRARDIMASLSSQTPGRASVAVTSVSRGSGQAELAIRLALSAAKRVDYRVLLADFDIRKPQVAKRLGVSSKYFTVSDVLRESCPLGEALMMSEEDNLYVLPARESDRAGDEVLNDKQVQTLVTQMHETFDFVVISCGPMDHADATIVCRHAGATALAAFCGYTSARAVRAAAERLSEAGVNVAGLLLAGAG